MRKLIPTHILQGWFMGARRGDGPAYFFEQPTEAEYDPRRKMFTVYQKYTEIRKDGSKVIRTDILCLDPLPVTFQARDALGHPLDMSHTIQTIGETPWKTN